MLTGLIRRGNNNWLDDVPLFGCASRKILPVRLAPTYGLTATIAGRNTTTNSTSGDRCRRLANGWIGDGGHLQRTSQIPGSYASSASAVIWASLTTGDPQYGAKSALFTAGSPRKVTNAGWYARIFTTSTTTGGYNAVLALPSAGALGNLGHWCGHRQRGDVQHLRADGNPCERIRR